MGADRSAFDYPWALQSANVSPSVVGTAIASFDTFLDLLAVVAPTDGVMAETAGASAAGDGLGATYRYQAARQATPVFPQSGRPIGDTAGAWVQTSQTGAGTSLNGDVTGVVGNSVVAKFAGAAVPAAPPSAGQFVRATSPTALTFTKIVASDLPAPIAALVSLVDIGAYSPDQVGLDVAFNALFADPAIADGVVITTSALAGKNYAPAGKITQTKACTVQWSGCTISPVGDFWQSNGKNVRWIGHSKQKTVIVAPNSARVLIPADDWSNAGNPGRNTIELRCIDFRGGASAGAIGTGNSVYDLDDAQRAVESKSATSPALTGLTESDIRVEDCTAEFFALAFRGGPSCQNAVFSNIYFYYNTQCIVTGVNAETTIRECWNTAPPAGSDQFVLRGPKVHFGPKNVLLRGNVSTVGSAFYDVLLDMQVSGSTGSDCWILHNVFGPEGENLYPRARVGFKNADGTKISRNVEIAGNLFGGCSVGQFWTKAIARDAAGACTASVTDINGTAQGHGIPVSSTALVGITQAFDSTFNGIWLMTATSTTALSWTQTDASGAAYAGHAASSAINNSAVLSNAGAYAIDVQNPLARAHVHHNEFFFFRYGAQCTQTWDADTRGLTGQSIWEHNRATPPNSIPFEDFLGTPYQFSIVEPAGIAGGDPMRPRTLTVGGMNNRIKQSGDLTSGPWTAAAGVTTSRVAGEDGVAASATRITKTAAWTPGFACLYQTIDAASIPGVVWLRFKAKGGALSPTPQMQVALIENGTTRFLEVPYIALHPTQWRWVEIPITVRNTGAGHTFSIFPGGYGDNLPCDIDIEDDSLCLSDRQQDPLPNASTTAARAIASAERRFEGDLIVTGIIAEQRNAKAPTILAGFTGLGASGTCVVMPGSNDLAGTILLRPAGAGPGMAGIVDLVFARPMPDTNPPTILATYGDYDGNWATANNGLRAYIDFGQTSPWTKARFVWSNGAVTALTAGVEYRLHYYIVRKV